MAPNGHSAREVSVVLDEATLVTVMVAPVIAVFVMRWTASAAMSAGPTTRPIGSVVRSCSRRSSIRSPSSEADNGVSTKPAAIKLTRMGGLPEQVRLAVHGRTVNRGGTIDVATRREDGQVILS